MVVLSKGNLGSLFSSFVIYTSNYRNYTLTYHLDGGVNNESNPSSYTAETCDFTFANPTKEGYKFIGWYTNANFTQQISTLNGKSENLNLYAKWVKESGGSIVTQEDTFN